MSHSPRGPSSGRLAPVPATALAARGSLLAARAPAAPRRAQQTRGLAGSLAQSHCPRVLSFPGVSPAEGEEGVQSSWQGWGCAAGSMLGSRGLTGALCLGLAARHLRNVSKRKLWDICNGEQGQCCAGQGWWGRGRSLGRVLPCLALLQENASGAEEHVRGTWGILEQQLPAGLFVSAASPGHGSRWVGLAWSGGGSWGSLQAVGVQVCSASFSCSPPALSE